MPLPRVLEPEVMSGAEEATEYNEMDFSATDRLFAERAAELSRDGKCIVDLGSGNAKIPLMMARFIKPSALICATEMSAEMLAVAAKNREREGVDKDRLILLRADAKRLPFPDASVDFVTSNSLVHHVADPADVFSEIARISGRFGSILIRDLIRPENELELERLVETHASNWSPLQRTLFSDSLHAALTLNEVRDCLSECGLSDVRVEQITDRHWSAERA